MGLLATAGKMHHGQGVDLTWLWVVLLIVVGRVLLANAKGLRRLLRSPALESPSAALAFAVFAFLLGLGDNAGGYHSKPLSYAFFALAAIAFVWFVVVFNRAHHRDDAPATPERSSSDLASTPGLEVEFSERGLYAKALSPIEPFGVTGIDPEGNAHIIHAAPLIDQMAEEIKREPGKTTHVFKGEAAWKLVADPEHYDKLDRLMGLLQQGTRVVRRARSDRLNGEKIDACADWTKRCDVALEAIYGRVKVALMQTEDSPASDSLDAHAIAEAQRRLNWIRKKLEAEGA